MSENTEELVFYIIMRNDLASMNPGKAMAQAAHAGEVMRSKAKEGNEWRSRYLEWASQAGVFGTTIVLAAGVDRIRFKLQQADRGHDVLTGWVYDPSYPIRDGDVTHELPLDTCAFVFGPRQECVHLLSDLKLHP